MAGRFFAPGSLQWRHEPHWEHCGRRCPRVVGLGLLLIVLLASLAACDSALEATPTPGSRPIEDAPYPTSPATTPDPTSRSGGHFVMPTPMAPVSEPPYTPMPETFKYIVQAGDTLFAIANRYDVSVDELIALNRLQDPNRLAIGQELLIPLKARETPTPLL